MVMVNVNVCSTIVTKSLMLYGLWRYTNAVIIILLLLLAR